MIDVLIIDEADEIRLELSKTEANVQCLNNEVQALSVIEKLSSAIVLLHGNTMQGQTVDYIQLLLKTNSNIRVVVIAEEETDENQLSYLLAGAQGYQQLSRLTEYSDRLIAAIELGEAWITRRMTATLLDALRKR
ncbi:MAG: response regulator transcription factor [Cycloclasticus sp.]|nr:response regulator transcription factor [Cycloclasticus sp.]